MSAPNARSEYVLSCSILRPVVFEYWRISMLLQMQYIPYQIAFRTVARDLIVILLFRPKEKPVRGEERSSFLSNQVTSTVYFFYRCLWKTMFNHPEQSYSCENLFSLQTGKFTVFLFSPSCIQQKMLCSLPASVCKG